MALSTVSKGDYGDVKAITKVTSPTTSTVKSPTVTSGPQGGGYVAPSTYVKPVAINAPSPTAPATPAPVAPVNSSLGSLTAGEITAMIAFLEAQTGLTKEQLVLQDSEIGRTMSNLLNQLTTAHEQQLSGLQNEFVGRGLLRSGIFANKAGELGTAVNQQAQKITEEAAGAKSNVAMQASSLEAQMASQIAAAVAEIEKSNLEPGVAAALKQKLAQLNLDILNGLANNQNQVRPGSGGQFSFNL